jgi:hypothetical protein
MSAGTSPPCRSTSCRAIPTTALAFWRKKPVCTISGSISAGSTAANARASGYAAKSAGVTRFTRASVDCAERMVATSSSKGVR